MFTRANFDIKRNPTCTRCKTVKATRIVTNTIVNYKGDIAAFPSAFCINCWNEVMELDDD